MTLGEKLRAVRKNAGLTIEELTTAFNDKFELRANKGMVSKWENDLVEPSSPYITAYAKLFGLDLNELLNLPPSDENYYHDPEAAALADMIKDNPRYRVLFEASRNLSADDVDFVIDMINKLAKTDEDFIE
ncbi:MAG: helix-turn-helix transcriptional regulator [Negativicoccus succinicivorans]|uniref:helix-turn-helix domain-containing protein n=1 Tax=Negativicoccus succinicivorans TaxID=620903 RepID=UPI00290EBB77|nr:helix-turn-helix transcriptional regulator [Negativicoccus succinicivorans]MDU5942742.1 helix-turn-helix transcriptional regulator [Negativicoccus succinicivorans]